MDYPDEAIQVLLKKDPVEAVIEAGYQLLGDLSRNESSDWFDSALDTFALIQVWMKKNGWNDYIPVINTADPGESRAILLTWGKQLVQTYEGKKSNSTFSQSLNRYETLLGTGDFYELTDGDIKRIQTLISQLREQIDQSNILSNEHKRRMLKRLEKLQAELHKRMSDYDRAYGMLIDGVILTKKFGESIQPITELIREIGNLFWRAHARGLELSGDSPLPLLTESKSE